MTGPHDESTRRTRTSEHGDVFTELLPEDQHLIDRGELFCDGCCKTGFGRSESLWLETGTTVILCSACIEETGAREWTWSMVLLNVITGKTRAWLDPKIAQPAPTIIAVGSGNE